MPRRRRPSYREIILVPRSSTYLFLLECFDNPLATLFSLLLLLGTIGFLSGEEFFPKSTPPKKIYTQSPQAQKLLIECSRSFSANKNDVAIDYCTQAIKIDPKFSEAYALRGTVYMFLDDHDERRENYKKDYQKALALFQSQGYHKEAESMKKAIKTSKHTEYLRSQNAQN